MAQDHVASYTDAHRTGTMSETLDRNFTPQPMGGGNASPTWHVGLSIDGHLLEIRLEDSGAFHLEGIAVTRTGRDVRREVIRHFGTFGPHEPDALVAAATRRMRGPRWWRALRTAVIMARSLLTAVR